MRVLTWVCLFAAASSVAAGPREPVGRIVEVSTSAELAEVLASPGRDLTVRLVPGTYILSPTASIDSTCGNCEDPDTLIPMTTGLVISGRDVRIVGPERGEAVIFTRAGYGLYVRDCRDCVIERVTITGGERDTSGMATDAAIVAKRSTLAIRDCLIVDNIGDPATVEKHVVGIMGICGREGSSLTIERNEIVRNSWDGIALYRDADATIRHNLVDGVDRAGREAGGGRGVAIGVTWNGRAVIERNHVRRYWKGIGAFVDADVEARANIVEEMRTWGMSLWDADRGRPRAIFEENVVFDCGACGISVTRAAPYGPGETPGRVSRNIVVQTGQDPRYDAPDYYCYQCALALHAVPEGFVIRGNAFFDNREAADSLFEKDLPREMFWRKRRGWTRTYRNTEVGVDGRHRFHESAFLARYGRWYE